jgi:hypothetical protein
MAFASWHLVVCIGEVSYFFTLSPDFAKSLTGCLASWRTNPLCTVVLGSHFCFWTCLLESVLVGVKQSGTIMTLPAKWCHQVPFTNAQSYLAAQDHGQRQLSKLGRTLKPVRGISIPFLRGNATKLLTSLSRLGICNSNPTTNILF